jgi:bacteriorhodopsin
MNYLNITAFGSLFIQFITGLFELRGLFFETSKQDKIVQDVLLMELIVQAIEFLFYIYLVYMIYTKHVTNNITSHRYFDWLLTTPVMLISFVVFFKYLKNPSRSIRLVDSVKEEYVNIIKIVIANALMLLFGFLGERAIINPYIGITIGFIPFAYAFKILYCEYAKHTTISQILYYISFITWGLYGVSAVLPFTQKNTMYNILDLFAKNAYGLFLYFFLENKVFS